MEEGLWKCRCLGGRLSFFSLYRLSHHHSTIIHHTPLTTDARRVTSLPSLLLLRTACNFLTFPLLVAALISSPEEYPDGCLPRFYLVLVIIAV